MSRKPLAARATNSDPTNLLIAGGFASIEDAMEFLSLGRAKIYQLMNDGELAAARFGRSRRIPWTSLHAYAAKCVVA